MSKEKFPNRRNVDEKRHRELFDLLLKEGLITQEILETARSETQRTGLSIE